MAKRIPGQLIAQPLADGWATKDEAYEICANGVCEVVPRGRAKQMEAASSN